jgi:tetratricopeptide (TPR) repeat protein
MVYPLMALAEAYRTKKQIETAARYVEKALSIPRQNEERGFGAWALYYLAKIQCDYAHDQMQESMNSFGQAKEKAAELGMRPLLAHCHMGLGQLYLKRGRIDEARSELGTAIELYHSMDMSFWLPQAESSLSKINT